MRFSVLKGIAIAALAFLWVHDIAAAPVVIDFNAAGYNIWPVYSEDGFDVMASPPAIGVETRDMPMWPGDFAAQPSFPGFDWGVELIIRHGAGALFSAMQLEFVTDLPLGAGGQFRFKGIKPDGSSVEEIVPFISFAAGRFGVVLPPSFGGLASFRVGVDAGMARELWVDNIFVSENAPPNCSQAAPTIAEIWPPNHKMVDVGIVGVTDPDGDPVTITITGITQDEPVNGLADGDTGPDGAGIGTSTAQVRAERAGSPKVPGNGRFYVISFVAGDGQGGECMGRVAVCVPHDQRPGHTCINDGQVFDSTVAGGRKPDLVQSATWTMVKQLYDR